MPKFSRRAFLRALAATPLAAFVPLLSRVPASVAPTVADFKRVGDKLPPLQPMWHVSDLGLDPLTVEHGELTPIMGLDTRTGRPRVIGAAWHTPTALTDAQLAHLDTLDCPFELHLNPPTLTQPPNSL